MIKDLLKIFLFIILFLLFSLILTYLSLDLGMSAIDFRVFASGLAQAADGGIKNYEIYPFIMPVVYLVKGSSLGALEMMRVYILKFSTEIAALLILKHGYNRVIRLKS